MTFFLERTEQVPQVPANNPDIELPSWLDGLVASAGSAQLETDANFRVMREREMMEVDLADQAAQRIGLDAIIARNEESADGFGYYDYTRPAPVSIEEGIKRDGYEFTSAVLGMAREAAEADPDAWSDIDLSDDAINARINEKLQAEHMNLQLTLAMMTGGQGSANLIGGMVGVTADVKNLPFLVLGGGSGSFARVMGREAMINVGAEMAFMPAQYEMAERLDIPDPDILKQLTFAAGGGALFGGAFEALGRGYRAFQGRQQVKSLPGRTGAESSILVDQVEDILAASDDPIKDLIGLSERDPANPLNPGREPLILSPDDRITTSRIPGDDPQAPLPDDVIVNQAHGAIDEAQAQFDADFPEMRFKSPLAHFVKQQGGVQYRRLNPATGEMELTHAAQELGNMGITPKTHPFIWRKAGSGDLDNIPIIEGDGLADVIRHADDGLYFDRDDLIERLGRELATGEKTPMSAEIAFRMDEVAVSGRSPADDFLSGARSDEPDGLYVDLNLEHFDGSTLDADARIQTKVDEWLVRKGYADALTDAERAEVVRELQKHGGDGEYLVERMLERELDYSELPPREVPDYDDVPFGDPEPAAPRDVSSGNGGGRSQGPDTKPEGGGPEGRGDDRGSASEATDAGDQLLIDGVEPVSQRQRFEAAQDTPLRGGDAPADLGLFDATGRAQTDMFSDITSPEARVIHDAVEADLRTDIEAGEGFVVDMDDGKGPRPVAEVLDDMDAAKDFSEIIDLCGRPK